jgi:hypothetical protein
MGNICYVFGTRELASANRSLSNPLWDKEMVFVVAELFEDYLLLSVEDRVAPGRDEVVGRVILPMTAIEKRSDEKPVTYWWFKSSISCFCFFFFFIVVQCDRRPARAPTHACLDLETSCTASCKDMILFLMIWQCIKTGSKSMKTRLFP